MCAQCNEAGTGNLPAGTRQQGVLWSLLVPQSFHEIIIIANLMECEKRTECLMRVDLIFHPGKEGNIFIFIIIGMVFNKFYSHFIDKKKKRQREVKWELWDISSDSLPVLRHRTVTAQILSSPRLSGPGLPDLGSLANTHTHTHLDKWNQQELYSIFARLCLKVL